MAETSFHKLQYPPTGCLTLISWVNPCLAPVRTEPNVHERRNEPHKKMTADCNCIHLSSVFIHICSSSGSWCQRKEEKSLRWETNDRKGEIIAIFFLNLVSWLCRNWHEMKMKSVCYWSQREPFIYAYFFFMS